MPRYTITDPSTGRTMKIEGDSPPTEQELEEIFGSQTSKPLEQPQAQQPQQSTGSFGDELSSSLGKRATAIKDIAADTDMGMPRKILRGAGEIAGGIVDVPMSAMKSGLAASTQLPIVGKGLQAAGNLGKQALSGAMDITNRIPGVQAGNRALSGIAERNPEAMKDLEALGNIGSVIPVGKVAGVAREAAAFGAGKGLQAAGAGVAGVGRIGEKAGKAILKGEAKINKNIAQKAAGNFTDGKQKIINDIAKFDLQSTKKGFAGIVDNANAAIEQRMTKGSEALKRVSTENPNAKINLDGITARYRDDLKTGKTIPFDEIERADAIREEITDKLKQQLGFDINDVAELSLEQADEARKLLSKGVFKKGAFSQTDPIRDQIKQDMALKIRDKMADYVPELTQGNREIRDLINVKKAADEAATRISGHNQIFGAGNVIAGGAGALIGAGNPLTAAAMIGAKKTLESGRGASGLISAGKGISATGEKISGLGKRLMPELDDASRMRTQVSSERMPKSLLLEEAKKYDNAEDFKRSLAGKNRKASEVTEGEYVRFTPPDNASRGNLGTEQWFGTDRLKQYNDGDVSGRVVKSTPKSIIIKAERAGEWNDGRLYKIPKDANASIDLSEFKANPSLDPIDIWKEAKIHPDLGRINLNR